jgi:hypothetical protein
MATTSRLPESDVFIADPWAVVRQATSRGAYCPAEHHRSIEQLHINPSPRAIAEHARFMFSKKPTVGQMILKRTKTKSYLILNAFKKLAQRV